MNPTPISPEAMPPGDYAIVEALGHRTLVGRVCEIERFGTRLLQIEPLFGEWLLSPVLLGGGSIYQFTPCTPDIAWSRRPSRKYEIPPSLAATLSRIEPEAQLGALPDFLDGDQ